MRYIDEEGKSYFRNPKTGAKGAGKKGSDGKFTIDMEGLNSEDMRNMS